MSTVTVALDEIESVARLALIKHNAADWIAEHVAHAVRTAEANQNIICGLYYLESYCIQLASGRVDGNVEPLITKPRTAIVQANARKGFAQPAFARGLPEALKLLKDTGTCTLAVSHAHTCTSLGYFTEQIALAGAIGIGFANASAVVSPPGGSQVAFQFDQSTSAVALGKITQAATAGESIPLGWAVDSRGKPTTDPKAALKGSLLSTGGYKGYGFGLMVEVLAAAVTGSVNSVNVKGLKLADGPPHDLGQYYFLVDPTAISGDAFWDRMTILSDSVDAQENARLPGSKRQPIDEVTINAELWALAQSLAAV